MPDQIVATTATIIPKDINIFITNSGPAKSL